MLFAHVDTPGFLDLAGEVCFTAARQTEQRSIDLSLVREHPVGKWLASAGIDVSHATSFYTAPLAVLPVHIDSDMRSNWCKLNLIFGGAGLMTWYECSGAGRLFTTPDGLPYTDLTTEQAVRLQSARVHRSTLVNVGVPHSLTNISKHPRWALSLVLRSGGNLLTVEEAYEKLGAIQV